MPKRKAIVDEWDDRKDFILDLYLRQDKSLKEVMAAMKMQGFTKTQAHITRLIVPKS
jgi:hypothetical protein